MIGVITVGFLAASGALAVCVICGAVPQFLAAAGSLKQELAACPAQREMRYTIIDTSVTPASAEVIRPDFGSRTRSAPLQTGLRAAA